MTTRHEMAQAASDMTDIGVDAMEVAASVPDDDSDAAFFLSVLVRYRHAMARGEVLPGETPPEWYMRSGGESA